MITDWTKVEIDEWHWFFAEQRHLEKQKIDLALYLR
jgi:hypothetical protein